MEVCGHIVYTEANGGMWTYCVYCILYIYFDVYPGMLPVNFNIIANLDIMF